MSYEVRGVSVCGSCTGSNMDCREPEEVSVLLLLSKAGGFCLLGAGAACGTGAGPEFRGLDIPVMSMFLKPSTSNDASLFLALAVPLLADLQRSMSANVLEHTRVLSRHLQL